MSIFMCERSSDWVNDAFDYQSILGIIDPNSPWGSGLTFYELLGDVVA